MERELTLEEKTLLIEGHNNWNTYEIKDLDIVKTTMCDGPLGLRKEVGNEKSNIYNIVNIYINCFLRKLQSNSI